MELNLTILADFLSDYEFLYRRTDRHTRRTLNYPVFYTGETQLKTDRVYIAEAERLVQQPVSAGGAALICLGYPPSAYHEDKIELLCLPTSLNLFALFNQVTEIFHRFQECERKIIRAEQQDHAPEAIAEIAFSLFQEPISAVDRHDRYLFFHFDPSRPEFLETYQNVAQGDYSFEEERSIFMADKDFRATYLTHGPCFAASPIFGTQTIYMNIFEESQYIGRILIENAYRKFRDSDYVLIEWLAGHIEHILIRTGIFDFGTSKEFDLMMRSLLLDHMPYQNKFEQILRQQNWSPGDTYLCIFLRTTAGQHPGMNVNNDAFYLRELFDSHYILIHEDSICQVINLTQSRYSQGEISRRLHLFLNNNDYVAGLSSLFQGFPRIWNYLQQAMLVAEHHKPEPDCRIFSFEKNVLSILLENARGRYSGELYFTDAIQRLLKYDQENDSELVKTLKHYLENNLSTSRTQEQLHVARTTCLYRISRIESISRLNLKDPDTQLYLRLLFRLTNIA